MSIDGRAKGYGTIWSDWTIGELLGHGSGGKTAVYKLTRVNHGFVEEDVLKVVNIIEEDLGIDEMSEDFRADYLAREKDAIERAESEVNLMHKLRNCNNIITYQDFKFHPTREEHLTAVDLLIRMHKYTDLSSIVKRKHLLEQEVVKVGIDICTALEGCSKNGIIHRDIKPENIFFDDNQYLLGDFGISRILENGLMAQTSKGTPPYAAPEQFDTLRPNGGYDFGVDIYSLGLTLYVLANKGKLPFMDKYASVNNALMMRLSGNPIPAINDINPELNSIILKACAFNPEDRFCCATDMKENLQDLQRILRKSKGESPQQYNKERSNVSYATEPALGSPVVQPSYATEPALGSLVVQPSYATEPALGSPVVQTGYATEPALGSPVVQPSYATEPALGSPVVQPSYATEPALGSPVVQPSYATEPALGSPVVQPSYATEPVFEESLISEKEPEKLPESVQEELPAVSPVIEKHDIETDEEPRKKSEIITEEVDYKALAIKEMSKGNNEKAVEWFSKLIRQGDWNAMYDEVKNRYSNADAIRADATNAIFWYKQCVECCKDSWTISLAEYQLGEIYANGIGVKKDHKVAEKYYWSSASKGNPYAKKKFVAGKYVK